MAQPALTDQQQRVLDFVERFAGEHGFPPSLREIGQAIGLANVNAVRGHLIALEKKGYITKDSDKARSIRVVEAPSILSRFKKRLHEWARTDEGVLHGVVYGLAWMTWGRTPYFEGERLDWMREAIEREAVEHGWTILNSDIRPDHVVLVVKVWPNHSPERTVRRLQMAGRTLKRRHPEAFPGKHLWGTGYVATTDLDLLEELVKRLLAEPRDTEERS